MSGGLPELVALCRKLEAVHMEKTYHLLGIYAYDSDELNRLNNLLDDAITNVARWIARNAPEGDNCLG